MSKPAITLAFDEYRNREVVSLKLAKDFELINKVDSLADAWLSEQKPKLLPSILNPSGNISTEIYTHVSMRNLKNLKNPLDQFGGIT